VGLIAGAARQGLAEPTAAASEAPPSFRREVVAVLSRAGCNQGTCHGNRNGKGGFKLSLRGEDPDADYLALTRDVGGRRLCFVDPDQSLVLRKPSGEVAHEGGTRFARGSREHQILRDWIARGAPRDLPAAPTVRTLEVTPLEAEVIEPDHEVMLRATARLSDGRAVDVTGLCVFEGADSGATVSPDGVVHRQAFGESVVLVRYLRDQVPIRVDFVRHGAREAWKAPIVCGATPSNAIDDFVLAKLRRLGVRSAEQASDSVLLRRLHLDLLGTLPASEEARSFASDPRPMKIERLVDRLLRRPEFSERWALRWSDLLRNEERTLDAKGSQTFFDWIRRSFEESKPLDVFAREVITGRGSTYSSPPANYYRAARDPTTRAESAAQVFLGVRLQCARCHSHPFDRWTQDDYYGWSGYFAGIEYKVLENRRRDRNDGHEFVGEQVVWFAPEGKVKDPRTDRPAPLRLLGTGQRDEAPESARLERLAAWVTSPSNPFFARAQANRIWASLLGRGIVEPMDDFRATNPPSHPELLDALAKELVASGYDVRSLVRRIVLSRTYQLAAALPDGEPGENAPNDVRDAYFAHASIRRLTAEELLDAYTHVTGASALLGGFPAGMRAGQLPGVGAARALGRPLSPSEQFLMTFGKPQRLLTCECERSDGTTLAQAFQLLSGSYLDELLTRPENRLAALIGSGRGDADIIEDLFWTALSRAPTPAEAASAARVLGSAEGPEARRRALEDIVWGILNSKELLFRT
jgi:hypothetical protein